MTMQVAIQLDDAEHDAFNHWLAITAAVINPDDPHLEPGEAIRAMIRVTLRYPDISAQVANQLRHERAGKAPPIIAGPDMIDRP